MIGAMIGGSLALLFIGGTVVAIIAGAVSIVLTVKHDWATMLGATPYLQTALTLSIYLPFVLVLGIIRRIYMTPAPLEDRRRLDDAERARPPSTTSWPTCGSAVSAPSARASPTASTWPASRISAMLDAMTCERSVPCSEEAETPAASSPATTSDPAAVFYDGRSNHRHAVTLRRSGALEIYEDGRFVTAWAYPEIRRADGPEGILRLRTISGGQLARLEIADPALRPT